jgi:hypothetical protein
MDGTGKLFDPLLGELPNNIHTQVISLNSLDAQEPKEQALEIASLIDNDELIILSESYSGYIAYQLSLLPNLNIKHIIFAASFLENPKKFSRFNKLLSLRLVRSGLIPDFILSSIFLFNATIKNWLSYFFHLSS